MNLTLTKESTLLVAFNKPSEDHHLEVTLECLDNKKKWKLAEPKEWCQVDCRKFKV